MDKREMVQIIENIQNKLVMNGFVNKVNDDEFTITQDELTEICMKLNTLHTAIVSN